MVPKDFDWSLPDWAKGPPVFDRRGPQYDNVAGDGCRARKGMILDWMVLDSFADPSRR